MTDNTPRLSAGIDPEGAYGPTIVLQLASDRAVSWLRQLLEVADAGKVVQLVGEVGVRLDGIDGIELGIAAEDGRWELVKLSDRPDFTWRCTRERWQRDAQLLDPFLGGRAGHQYLTSEATDDAVIEIAFGEAHPGL